MFGYVGNYFWYGAWVRRTKQLHITQEGSEFLNLVWTAMSSFVF